MKNTRTTQPYRKGTRAPSIVLTNMKRGKTLFGQNPMDAQRKGKKRVRVKIKRRRPR